jgi:hypothetical protein
MERFEFFLKNGPIPNGDLARAVQNRVATADPSDPRKDASAWITSLASKLFSRVSADKILSGRKAREDLGNEFTDKMVRYACKELIQGFSLVSAGAGRPGK